MNSIFFCCCCFVFVWMRSFHLVKSSAILVIGGHNSVQNLRRKGGSLSHKNLMKAYHGDWTFIEMHASYEDKIYQFRRQVLAICRISETSGCQLWADLINRCRWRRFHFCQELTHRQHLCSNTLQCQPVHQLNKLIIGNSPYIIQTPVSCRKRKRFTLNNHTVNTVIINKNIMTSRNAVSISLYFFSFSAASFSLTKSLSSFCASTMVENETSKK